MKTLLISAAAVMIAGSAFAQTGSTAQMPERAPNAQQSAPAEKTAPADAQVPPGQSRARDEAPSTTGQGNSSAQVPPGRSSPTTGQGAAGTSSNLTADQRSKITASLKQPQAPRATNVTFAISIGSQIPSDVKRAPLPATVIDTYPAWRGYEYVMVEGDILIIDPMTSRIVAIIEA